MEKVITKGKLVESKPLYLRKLTKSGSSRYLSVSTILPLEWVNLKVYVETMGKEGCILRIVPIE